MTTNEDDLLKLVDGLMNDERWSDAVAAAEPRLVEGGAHHELSWNVGWAYFKLEDYAKAELYIRQAIDNGPVSDSYFGALGSVLAAQKKYEKAEVWFLRALAVRDTSVTRLGLALAYLEQDLAEMGEAVHREGIRLRPDSRERLEAYADFLSDLGREEEAQKAYADAGALAENQGSPR